MNQIKANRNLNEKARWEHSSSTVIKNRIMRSRVEDMKRRHASDLNARKVKLAALLAAEDKQYE